MADSENYLRQLHKQLLAHFDKEELGLVCFSLGLEFDDLWGEGRPAKAFALLLLLARQDRLPQLLAIVREERPSIDWPDIPSDFQPPAPIDAATPSGAGFHIDHIQAASVNVGGIQHIDHLEVNIGAQTADSSPPPSIQVPSQLITLVTDLQQILAHASQNYAANSQKATERLEVLTEEMNKPTVDKEMLQMYAQSLARSTDKLTEALPQAAVVTDKIIEAIANWSV